MEPIAAVFGVSVAELLSGSAVCNRNVSGNMLRSGFCVCPVCGNLIHSMGQAVIQCHGILLTPAQPEQPDDAHRVTVEVVEDEYLVRIDHEMTKTHYISFVSTLSSDRVQTVKLYPEGTSEVRFPIREVSRILYYCNRDGLFVYDLRRHRNT